MKKNIITYVSVILLSAIVLYFWNGYAVKDANLFKDDVLSAKAKIVSVESRDVTELGDFESTSIVCKAKILSGKSKGKTVKVYQEYNTQMANMKIVEPGDKVTIKNFPREDIGVEWAIEDYSRTGPILFLVVLFAILIMVLGKTKGLRTVISLLYTCIAVFAIFIPSILSGKDIYLNAVLICVFIIVMTLLLISGYTKKTLAASLGCIGGVLAAAVIAMVFSNVMKFSGYTDEHSYYLTSLPHPVDLGAIAFSAIIIGAVGAVMDVAMSMSSSLHELSIKVPDISFKSLVSSGFEIGRDMMGTMANTLVLAYVGSSLSSVLLFVSYAGGAADLFNKEIIANEILQAVAGSIGILLTIPVTALICGLFYTKKSETSKKDDNDSPTYENAFREKISYKKELYKEKFKNICKAYKDLFSKNRLKK